MFGNWRHWFAAPLLQTLRALAEVELGHSSILADMAILFEKAFGIKVDTLLRLQSAYDLAGVPALKPDLDSVGGTDAERRWLSY